MKLPRIFQRHHDENQIGAYTLIERLGQGGMGEVWSAKHRELLRPAAIKILSAETAGESRDTLKKRFDREVHATAQLTSPHTIAIFDFGKTADNGLYYAMELLQGLDLERLVARFGPQPADRVGYLLQQVCESLEEAHHRGLVHRDIKPANLFAASLGMRLDFVKVLDFGLVRDMAHDLNLTADHTVSGTPAYMAPESAKAHQFDARTDLYSVGCVAYWLLTGRTVFQAETNAAMIAAHMYEDVIPPSRLTELTISPAIENIVLQLLAKDPANRPQSAVELREMLEARPQTWTQDRAEAWWRANVPDILAKSRG
ncbi:MAG: serine/threonine-protein kinase [Kofleriaceae bacterium]